MSQVGYVNLDGSGAVTSVQQNQVMGMEIVQATHQVYWIDQGAGAIMRANPDFSGVTAVVTGLDPAYHLNLAIDPEANLIFWSNGTADGSISRGNLSGGPILGTFASPGDYPDDVAVDAANQLLYWTTQSGEVFRSRYDGSEQVAVLRLSPIATLTGLALDLTAGHMYVASANERQIVRANLDGSSVRIVPTVERPFGMELFNGRMYWADLDGGRLRSANLDGSDVVTILSGLTYPRQVRILAEVSDGDSDHDGVLDSKDLCAGTAAGDIVDADGCSIDQLVPCDAAWKNHGQYVSAVAHMAQTFADQGLLTLEQVDAVIGAAARSGCAKP